MKPLVKKASPAAIAVLKQATALWPKRKKLSDGLLPSLAHQAQNPNSDHNTGLGVDLTHDPANGVNCPDIFQKLKADNRVEYLIHAGKIWSKVRANEGDRDYSGPNKHHHHLHISIKATEADNTSPWFAWVGTPTTLGKVKAGLQAKPKKKDVPSLKED